MMPNPWSGHGEAMGKPWTGHGEGSGPGLLFLLNWSWGLLERLKILLKAAKIVHYRQAHSENFQNVDIFDHLPTLTIF